MIVDLDLSDYVCPLHGTPLVVTDDERLACGCPQDEVLAYLTELQQAANSTGGNSTTAGSTKDNPESEQSASANPDATELGDALSAVAEQLEDAADKPSAAKVASNNGAAKNNGRPAKPTPIPPSFDTIPDELKALNQWVNWRYEWRPDKKGKGGKWTKPPFQPNTELAESTNPDTWSTFEAVRKAYQRGGFDGIGYVLSPDDTFVAFDLDHILDNQLTITDLTVADYVKRLNSYVERTPGGDGLRILVKATLPAEDRKKGNLECYSDGRYVTITGNPFPAGSTPLPIAERQAEVQTIHSEIFAERKRKHTKEREQQGAEQTTKLDDVELLKKARAAKNGAKFAALYDRGDWKGQEFPSQSEADLSLCSALAFWSGRNKVRMDSLFRQSKLMRHKWTRADYREHTLDEAIRGCKEIYCDTTLSADDSMNLARVWAEHNIESPDGRTLHRWQSKYCRWNGTCYVEQDDETIRTGIWNFLRYDARLLNQKEKTVLPKSRQVNECADALKAYCQLPTSIRPPCWLESHSGDAGNFIPVRNGLLNLSTRELLSATPQWFDFSVVSAHYDPDALCPQWDKFLEDLWPDDQQSRDCLQEIFGYVVSADTSQQKSFMLIGPPRSGKGTIARVAATLVGPEAVVRPALADFQFQFGLEPLINKSLAIMSDARLGNTPTTGLLIERLLAISGEDSISVPRKFLPAWAGQLRCRFLILSNELPAFSDASGALPSRFILLKTTKSYLHQEDPTLFPRLSAELPGILNWCLDGWMRLQERGHFAQPDAVREMAEDLAAMANPLGSFLDEACELGPDKTTTWSDLHRQYVDWCSEHAMRPNAVTIFGRDLRAARPELKTFRPHGEKSRHLAGIAPSHAWRIQFDLRKTQRGGKGWF